VTSAIAPAHITERGEFSGKQQTGTIENRLAERADRRFQLAVASTRLGEPLVSAVTYEAGLDLGARAAFSILRWLQIAYLG
jgi:hypothetical protein